MRITGVVVRERIPDRLLDEADEVVVVDVTPETLEERLLEGKIYAPERNSTSAAELFPTPSLDRVAGIGTAGGGGQLRGKCDRLHPLCAVL